MTNPILSEIDGMSPAAKSAMLQAHQATVAQAQAAPIAGTGEQPLPKLIASPDAQPNGPRTIGVMGGVGQDQPPPKLLSMPKSPMPSLTPASQPNVTLAPQPRGTLLGDQAELTRELNSGSGVSQISGKIQNSLFGQNHPTAGKFLGNLAAGAATIGDGLLRTFAPNLEQNLPGTEGHHQLLLNQNGRRVDDDVQNAQRQALTQHEQAETSNLQNPDRETVNTDNGVYSLNRKDGTARAVTDEATGEPLSPVDKTKDANLQQLHANAVNKAIQEGRDPSQDPTVNHLADAITSLQKQTPPKEISAVADLQNQIAAANQAGDKKKVAQLQSQLKDLNPFGEQHLAISMAGLSDRENPKAAKPTADEQRRADLAENLNENINTLEDIAKRRPELFGPLAGRMTSLKSTIGTSDEDIATLEAIKHQIGMAQISAHGMRSAHGIDAAAGSLLNNFNNSPAAMMAALNAARKSVGTFQNDADNPGESRTPQASGGTIRARDPKGVLHEAPAGTPLPAGWKAE